MNLILDLDKLFERTFIVEFPYKNKDKVAGIKVLCLNVPILELQDFKTNVDYSKYVMEKDCAALLIFSYYEGTYHFSILSSFIDCENVAAYFNGGGTKEMGFFTSKELSFINTKEKEEAEKKMKEIKKKLTELLGKEKENDTEVPVEEVKEVIEENK